MFLRHREKSFAVTNGSDVGEPGVCIKINTILTIPIAEFENLFPDFKMPEGAEGLQYCSPRKFNNPSLVNMIYYSDYTNKPLPCFIQEYEDYITWGEQQIVEIELNNPLVDCTDE